MRIPATQAAQLVATESLVRPQTIDLAGTLGLIRNSKCVVIDIRSESLFRKGHIEGAINIPYRNIKAGNFALKLLDAPNIVIYCDSIGCGQANAAARDISTATKASVFVYLKGWREWAELGLPYGKAP